MPIHIDFFHPDRLAIVVARGIVTGEEISEAIRQMLSSGALHYRKIIDIASPSTPMDDASLDRVVAWMRAQPNAASRGPVAFLVGPGRAADNAEKFAKMTESERPVKVFHSLHEARKWLEQHPLGTL